MAHTVMVEFPCNEGQGQAFLDVLLPGLSETRAFEGCELVETYRDAANPDTVILWEKWAAKQNQEAYLAWRMENGMGDLVAQFMDPAKMRFLDLTPQD